jgi:hypothetical protein
LEPVGRCQQCGYVLRYDRYGYRCDFCGFTHIQRSWTQRFQDLERTLSGKFQSVLDSIMGPRYPQTITYSPVWLQQEHRCIACGLYLPAGTQRCPRCGAAQIVIPATPVAREEPQTPDQRVLDYIVAHDGTISLSQAARDLSVSPGELRSTLERLKSAGFLNQA